MNKERSMVEATYAIKREGLDRDYKKVISDLHGEYQQKWPQRAPIGHLGEIRQAKIEKINALTVEYHQKINEITEASLIEEYNDKERRLNNITYKYNCDVQSHNKELSQSMSLFDMLEKNIQ